MGVCTSSEKPKSKDIKVSNSFYLEGYIKGKERKEVIQNINDDNRDIKSSNPENSINNSNNKTNKDLEEGIQNSIKDKDDNISNSKEKEYKKVTPNIIEENKLKVSKNISKANYDLFGSQQSNNQNKDKDKEAKKSIVNENKLSSSNKELEQKKFTNGNNSSIKENLEDNYKDFDINKEHYLTCGDCNFCITYIYSVEFVKELNDFKFTYKCQCEQNENENKEKYLHEIIRDKKICDEHFATEIKYICETCKKQICQKCKDSNTHLDHDIKPIRNNEVIPESIMDTIKDKQKDFKGFKIFQKIFDFYKITKLPDEQEISRNSENSRSTKKEEENPFKKSSEKNKEEIKQEQNEQENKEEKKSENKESKIKDENINEQEIPKKSENDINVEENINVNKSKNKLENENENINGMNLNNLGNMNNIDDNERNEDNENENKNQDLNNNNNPLNINEQKEELNSIGEKTEIINIIIFINYISIRTI